MACLIRFPVGTGAFNFPPASRNAGHNHPIPPSLPEQRRTHLFLFRTQGRPGGGFRNDPECALGTYSYSNRPSAGKG